MATLREVEDEIAALTKRHADLDNKMVGYGGVDLSVGSAMSAVDKKIRELERRRTALLVGETDPVDVAKPAPSASPPQLRPPRWISAKDVRATAGAVHEKNVEIAKTLPLETSVDDLGELYGTEAHVAVIESALRGYSTEIMENGRACEFNEGLYAAFLTMFYRESAVTAATFHWAGNQRRLIEQRVEALESRRKIDAVQLQHIEHRLSPIFEAGVAKTVAPLLMRIEELENRPSVKYLGVWEAGRQYTLGNFVTDRGSVFHCNESTSDRPGDGKSWTLACKKGNDGKDSRHG